jgi:hypothetical protein
MGDLFFENLEDGLIGRESGLGQQSCRSLDSKSNDQKLETINKMTKVQ